MYKKISRSNGTYSKVKISIIIPTFNCEKYIARAIRSCLEQSFPKDNFEVIVIDDCSNDSTKYILDSFGHWIKVLRNRENRGISYARNKGIKNAKGEFIVNLDADDYLHRFFLNICDVNMQFNQCDAVATDYFLVDDKEKVLSRMDVKEKPIACGIMFRKEQMIDIGLYDESLQIGEDVDFRIRFEKKYKIETVNIPLYRYRMHKNNSTSDKIKNQKYLKIIAKKNNCNISLIYPSQEIKKDT